MIQVPPSPFGPEIRRHGDGIAEELPIGNIASQPPLRGGSEEPMELPSKARTRVTPSVQRFAGTEPGTPLQSAIGAIGELMEPPDNPGFTAPPFQGDRDAIAEVSRHTAPPAAQTAEPIPRTHNAPPASPLIISEPDEMTTVSPEESRSGAQRMSEPILPGPAIRPVPAESRAFLQFPKTTPASSPTEPAQSPIHVRIGRVEVRAATASTPMPARSSPPAPLGFDGYYRVRTYRS